ARIEDDDVACRAYFDREHVAPDFFRAAKRDDADCRGTCRLRIIIRSLGRRARHGGAAEHALDAASRRARAPAASPGAPAARAIASASAAAVGALRARAVRTRSLRTVGALRCRCGCWCLIHNDYDYI